MVLPDNTPSSGLFCLKGISARQINLTGRNVDAELQELFKDQREFAPFQRFQVNPGFFS